MLKYIAFFAAFFICAGQLVLAQKMATKSIKTFGAKGDGKTNDTEAFIKAAAFFTARGGNGTLTIPTGTYIVGRQVYNNGNAAQAAFSPIDIINLKNISNLTILGKKGTILKYADSLRLGSFDPVTKAVFKGNTGAVPLYKYAAVIGNCITLTNCRNITIKNIVLNGNNKAIQFGGRYDDAGIQLTHNGLLIKDCHSIFIDNITASYFGLDGVMLSNDTSTEPDNIQISNSIFEYNCRQGLSWIGGNSLSVKNSQFNHTGRSGYFSPPGAGVDIEPEINSIANGVFDNCQFINNTGCGVVTAGGAASNCLFTNSTFWGTTNWSIWVTQPSFSFIGCKIYGSIVHGYGAPNATVATRYIKCIFEDKLYNGKPSYGKYMIESDDAWHMLFDSCIIKSNRTSIAWLNTLNKSATQRATIQNSHFIINRKDTTLSIVLRLISINFKNNTIEYNNYSTKKTASAKMCCSTPNDKNGNKIIYSKKNNLE